MVRQLSEEAFDAATSLRLIAESLGLVDRLGADPIRVRDVRLADRTLVVEINVPSEDPIAVRGHIAGAMGALAGLDVPTLFPVLHVQAYGVRAFAPSDGEVMWIVSSPEAARFAGDGKPIEWLAHSIVQENSAAYRRSQADRRIGQLETALRDLLDRHGTANAGPAYLPSLWTQSQIGDKQRQAQAEGRDPTDSRVLVDYAFLPELGSAIADHLGWFDDGCIPGRVAFEHDLAALNKVRRKVAHHREVTAADLRVCEAVADSVLGPLCFAHPDLAGDFLVDRWEARVASIFAEAQATFASTCVPGREEVRELERRMAATRALEVQLAAVEHALDSMAALVAPAQRIQLQDAGVAALGRWKAALSDMVLLARRLDLTAEEAEAGRVAYEAALADVDVIRRRIQAIRVGLPRGE